MTEQKKTQKPKKRKLSIADLQTKPKRLTLVHPDETIDVGDAWVELIAPQSSLDYILTGSKIASMDVDNIPLSEQLSFQSEMVCAVITDWDEESFGVPYSKEAALKLFNTPDNFWIREQIQSVLTADADFFTKV